MFVVCGEALFDVFIEEGVAENIHTVPFSARVGGSPFNVAIGLARLEREAALLTGLSDDLLGQRLQAVLATEQVSQDYLVSKQAPTTLGFVQHGADGVPAYAFYGNGAADRSLEWQDIPEDFSAVTGIHLGSYSIVTPPTADTLWRLVQREAGQRIISLDPNIRPTVEPDLSRWRECVERLLPFVDVLKVSDEDLAILYPGQDPETILQAWLATGVRLLALTRGEKGATLWSQQARSDVQGVSVQVVDTVGAGDTFQAVLLDAVLQLLQSQGQAWVASLNENVLEQMGQAAVQAAAITCSRRGADLPRRSELTPFSYQSEA